MRFSKHKLGDLLRVTRGASLAGTGYADEGKFLRLTLANFNEEGGFKEFKSTQGKYFTDTFDRRFLMHKGDLITPLTEQSPGLLGSVALIPCDDLYIQSQDVGLITCNTDKLDKTFAYYLFLTHSVREQISARSQQTKIRHTSPDKIADVEVYIPDLPTQLRIAGVLGSLDEKIALNRKKIAELESLAKTIYDYWFVQFDFPDKNGKPYKSSGGKIIWNGQLKREVPEGWEACAIGDLCTCHDSKRIPLSGKQRSQMQGDVPYYGATGIMDHVNDYIFDGEYLLFAEDGSVMTEDGFPIMQIINGKTWVNNHAHVLSPRIKCSVKFLQLHFRNIPVRKIKTGSIQPKITKDNLFAFKVLSVPQAILECADRCFRDVQEQIENTSKQIDALSRQRDFLLPLLMNGQVVVK